MKGTKNGCREGLHLRVGSDVEGISLELVALVCLLRFYICTSTLNQQWRLLKIAIHAPVPSTHGAPVPALNVCTYVHAYNTYLYLSITNILFPFLLFASFRSLTIEDFPPLWSVTAASRQKKKRLDRVAVDRNKDNRDS